jgi:hypothetical protein
MSLFRFLSYFSNQTQHDLKFHRSVYDQDKPLHEIPHTRINVLTRQKI